MSLTREQIEWHKGRLIYGTPGGSKHIIPVEDSVALCDLALQALTPASAWRPISEAPKDGTHLWGYESNSRSTDAEEFFEFNVIGACVGPKTPLFLTRDCFDAG